MAVAHSTVNVGTSATSLTDSHPDRLRAKGDVARAILVQNTSASTVYVGGAGVTTTDYGVEVAAGDSLGLDLGWGEELYAVAASAVDVHVLHTGV